MGINGKILKRPENVSRLAPFSSLDDLGVRIVAKPSPVVETPTALDCRYMAGGCYGKNNPKLFLPFYTNL